MKLLILSDLHFREKNDWQVIDKIGSELIKRVKAKMKDDETIAIAVLGDIIDCGGKDNNTVKFAEASRFINMLKSEFDDARFYFIPGNHEIKDGNIICEFDEFYARHSLNPDFKFTNEISIFSETLSGFNMVFVDSVLARRHDANGEINITELKSNMKPNCKNIIFMHHPPCAQEGADRVVVNSAELISTHANFVFYGHQHGYVKVPDFLEHDTDIHSVGALFKQDRGTKNEFLLLDIADSKINYAYRYVFAVSSFLAQLMFPKKDELKSHEWKFDIPPKIEKVLSRRYKKVSSKTSFNERDSVFTGLIGVNIETLLKNNNSILLLGDAGVGKSFVLTSIYWSFQDNEDYFPIWISLRNTNYETIKRYVGYAQHNTIDNKTPVLIIDGLDEMKSENVADLIRDIGSAINGDVEVKIIISTRTNFKIELEHFEEYKILPLTDEDVTGIASEKGVNDIAIFMEELKLKNCLPLAKTPFYLFDIINIYKEKGSLPERNQLLIHMILSRFKNADDRYQCKYSESILGNEYNILLALKKLAFFMQSHHEYSLANLKYTRILETNIREQLRKTGLVVYQEAQYATSWEFEHNIFREFLVADLLKEISFDELLNIITYDEEKKKLRPSWVNVTSFLLSMREDSMLKEWLIQNAKDIICEIESDRLTLADRNDVFIAILQDCFDKGTPVYTYYNVEKLTRYFQSEETIKFILSVLKQSDRYYEVLSVLHILCYCTSFYGSEDLIQEEILKYLSADVSENIVVRAIKALSNLCKSNLSKNISIIFPFIKNDNRVEVAGAVCDLFAINNISDEYADYILEKLSNVCEFCESYSAEKSLMHAVGSFYNLNNLLSAMELLCKMDAPYRFYKSDELFTELIEKIHTILRGRDEHHIDTLIDIFIIASKKHYSKKTNALKQYFIGTNNLAKAFNKILELDLPDIDMMFAIETIMDESLTKILVEHYSANKVDAEIVKWYARRLPQGSPIFESLNRAVIEKENCDIYTEPRIDWEENNKIGNQKYFDSLLDKTEFESLINELIDFLHPEITCGELLGDSFSKVPNDREDMHNLVTALYHNGNAEWKVVDFVNSIDWDNFSIFQICKMLKDDKSILFDEPQKNVLEEYYNKMLQEINFETFDEKLPTSDAILSYAEQLVFLMRRYDFACNDEKILEFLMLPWYVFESSSVSSESETLKFVSDKISDPLKLRRKILENIRKKSLNPHASQTHILYCLEYRLPDAVNLATDLFKSTDENSRYLRNAAVDYLITLSGEKYVDDLIDANIDEDMLRYLAIKLENVNTNLISILIEKNQQSTTRMLFLEELIIHNSEYALQVYTELVKERNGLPDKHTDTMSVPEITHSIRAVNDISLLDHVMNLFAICLGEGFEDKDGFGLFSSLNSSIQHLIQVDKIKVKEKLQKMITDYPENEKLKANCNWHIQSIEKVQNVSGDTPWSIKMIIEYLNRFN
jgi:hypothetical protein